MVTASDWPADAEWTFSPTDEERETERLYCDEMDRVSDFDAYVESQLQLDDFSAWPLEDLLEELEMARTLTPDREGIIAEIE